MQSAPHPTFLQNVTVGAPWEMDESLAHRQGWSRQREREREREQERERAIKSVSERGNASERENLSASVEKVLEAVLDNMTNLGTLIPQLT